jgi:Tol biopolymer transport system component
MAPEQLDGLEADARTDIFAFGTVLHEMITGKRAFEGKSQILLISAIATNEPPPLSSAQPATPPALEHVVRTCLAKNPDDRWQTARDLLAELKWIAAGGAAATAIMQTPTTAVRRRSGWVLPAAAVLALGLAAVLAVPAYSYFQGPPPPQETRFRIWPNPYLPRAQQTGWFDLSADGSTMVYRGDQQGVNDAVGLYVGRPGELAIRRLPGTDMAAQPFLSPDGSDVAFVLDDRLMRLRVAGGQPEEIARVKNMFGGSWSEDGTILLGSSEGIYRVSAEGGRPEIVIPKAGAETGLHWPRVLPGGRRFLYLSWASAESGRAVMMGSLDGAPPAKLLSGTFNAAYASPGWLIFQRDDAVFAQRFDPEAGKLSGDQVRLASGVWFTTSNGLGAFSVSHNGDLLFDETSSTAASSDHELRRWQPVWLDQTGLPRPVGSVQIYRGAEISPDGSRIAMHRHDGEGGDVWITEPSGTETRLTYDPARDNSSPIWSPDGQHIVFGAFKDGKWGLYRRLSDGRGTEDVLYESERVATPMSWSKDGQRIVFGLSDAGTNGDLWVLTLESAGGPVSKTVKPEAFAATPANESHGQISPDGRWLAYASDETIAGAYEIYVRPFPAGAGRWQVSTTGGDWPRWSRAVQRLLFLNNVPENQTSQGATLYKVDYTVKGDTFVPQPPAGVVTMRALNLSHRGGDFSTYAVDDKGTLLVFTLAQSPTGAQMNRPDQESGLTLVRFWQHAPKRR